MGQFKSCRHGTAPDFSQHHCTFCLACCNFCVGCLHTVLPHFPNTGAWFCVQHAFACLAQTCHKQTATKAHHCWQNTPICPPRGGKNTQKKALPCGKALFCFTFAVVEQIANACATLVVACLSAHISHTRVGVFYVCCHTAYSTTLRLGTVSVAPGW